MKTKIRMHKGRGDSRFRETNKIAFFSTDLMGKREWVFFLSLAIYYVYMILSTSFYLKYIDQFWKPVFLFCIGLLLLFEFMKNRVSIGNILKIGIIGFVFINIMRVAEGSSQNAIGALLLYIYCARDIPFKRIAKFSVFISGIMLIFVVGSSLSGAIPNYVLQDNTRRDRQYLGFLYALYGPTIFSNIALLIIYIREGKIRLIEILGLSAVNYFLFVKTDSRLCFYLTELLIIFTPFIERHKEFLLRRKFLCVGMVFSFVICAAMSLYFTANYQPGVLWQARLNRILGGRLAYGKKSLDTIGYGLLGIKGIEWVGNGLDMFGQTSNKEYLFVDNFYVQVLQRYGLVFLILSIVLFTIAAYRCYKSGELYLLIVFAVLAVHFILDNLYMYLQYNTFWFAAGTLVFARKSMILNPTGRKNTIILRGRRGEYETLL